MSQINDEAQKHIPDIAHPESVEATNWLAVREFADSFIEAFDENNPDPDCRGLVGAATDVLVTAAKLDAVLVDDFRNRILIDPSNEQLHTLETQKLLGTNRSPLDPFNIKPVDAPFISLGSNDAGVGELVIAGVENPNSKNYFRTWHNGVSEIRILTTGEVRVVRTNWMDMNISDAEVIKDVELDLRRANAQSYINRRDVRNPNE